MTVLERWLTRRLDKLAAVLRDDKTNAIYRYFMMTLYVSTTTGVCNTFEMARKSGTLLLVPRGATLAARFLHGQRPSLSILLVDRGVDQLTVAVISDNPSRSRTVRGRVRLAIGRPVWLIEDERPVTVWLNTGPSVAASTTTSVSGRIRRAATETWVVSSSCIVKTINSCIL